MGSREKNLDLGYSFQARARSSFRNEVVTSYGLKMFKNSSIGLTMCSTSVGINISCLETFLFKFYSLFYEQ